MSTNTQAVVYTSEVTETITQIINFVGPIMVLGMLALMMRQLWKGMFRQSIPYAEKVVLERKYGAWAVGLAESFCPDDDVACVEEQAKKLLEARGVSPSGRETSYPEYGRYSDEWYGDIATQLVSERKDLNPEAIGGLLADATMPVVAWDRESRMKQLNERADARKELKRLAAEWGIAV